MESTISSSNLSIQFKSLYISLEKQGKAFINMERTKTSLDCISIYFSYSSIGSHTKCLVLSQNKHCKLKLPL